MSMQTPRPRPGFHTGLQFRAAAECVAWLEGLPLADTSAAHEMVAAQVEMLTRSDGVPPIERLRILEVLNKPIASLQQDFSRRFAGKPIPLSIVDYATWNGTIELWQTLYGAYRDALNAATSGEPALQRHTALLALRCLECTGASMREHERAYRAIPAGLWMQLHQVYDIAEQGGYAERSLDDPVGPAGATRSCVAAYVQAVLAARADPYALSARQMEFVHRWLRLWAPLARVTREYASDYATTTLAVDLESRRGAMTATAAGALRSIRFLDLDQISRSMRRALALLQLGREPAELGLGHDCRQPGTEALIALLHGAWFDLPQPTSRIRAAKVREIEACVGFHAAHRQLETGEGRSPERDDDAFAIRTAPWSPTIETWQLRETGPGFMLDLVRGPECEMRVQHHQLVGLRRSQGAPLQIGVLQRLELADNGELAMMVRLLPSAARAVAVRIAGERAAGNAIHRGVLLAGSEVPAAAPTLLLEPGHFRAGSKVEIATPEPRTLVLTQLIERGVDFDRAGFES